MKYVLLTTIAGVLLVGCATTVETEPATYTDVKGEEKVGNDKVNTVSKKDSSTSNSNSVAVSSSNSVVVSSSISYVDKDQKTGELHYKNTNGEATLKVINSDGKVVYDGPVNTKEQKSKVPTEAMKWLEKVNIKVEEVNIKVKPPAVN
jgi:osmotically-inducible protein OsmY|tara:strand:+ start:5228 stop:5671 length:444 start_codon:yes stop_codon:yes gene_type:complete